MGHGKITYLVTKDEVNGAEWYVPASVNEVVTENAGGGGGDGGGGGGGGGGGEEFTLWLQDGSPSTITPEQIDQDAGELETGMGASIQLFTFLGAGTGGGLGGTMESAHSTTTPDQPGEQQQQATSKEFQTSGQLPPPQDGAVEAAEEGSSLRTTQRTLAEDGRNIERAMMRGKPALLAPDEAASLEGTQQSLKEEGDKEEKEMMAAMTGKKHH